MNITWLGHSAVLVESAGRGVLFDPYLTENPSCPAGCEEKLGRVDFIAVTHGHPDHVGDAVRLAARYDAPVVAMPEVCHYLASKGVKNTVPVNIGGLVDLDGTTFALVHAQHSATYFEGDTMVPMGDPAGVVVTLGGQTVYHAGDTGLFSDMALIQRLFRPTVGMLPIGDRFTMGPEAAAIACNEFLDLEYIIPVHWGTWPVLTGTPDDLKKRVRRGEVLSPSPGETVEI